jgi:hypothetical protein
VIFPDMFGKRVRCDARAVRVLDHNYFLGAAMTDAAAIAAKLDEVANYGDAYDQLRLLFHYRDYYAVRSDDGWGAEEGAFLRDDAYLDPAVTVKTPSFPARPVVSYCDYDHDHVGGAVNLFIRPAVEMREVSAYQLVVMKQPFFSDETTVAGYFDDSGINTPVSIPVLTGSDNGLWTDMGSYYLSDWIVNGMEAVRLGVPEGATFGLGDKVHFFLRCASIVTGGDSMISSTMRHSSLDMDPMTFYVLLGPEDFLGDAIYKSDSDGDDDQLTVHLNTRFTGDIRIPLGKTLRFAENSGFPQDWAFNLAIDNGMHFIIGGAMEIDKGGQADYITFGPTGLTTYDEYKTNGMWGGIYILETGILQASGARIMGSLDGIVLYNNDTNSSLEDVEIKYCEIGLHLYNSYPAIVGNNIAIQGNLLYGVKEDKMTAPGYAAWKAGAGRAALLDGSVQNGYDYYDYKDGIVRRPN